jgi:hypothetical protein
VSNDAPLTPEIATQLCPDTLAVWPDSFSIVYRKPRREGLSDEQGVLWLPRTGITVGDFLTVCRVFGVPTVEIPNAGAA